MRNLLTQAAELLAKKRRHQIWMKVVGALACVVVFCTTYALILPAITMEHPTCGLEEHTHTKDCYEDVPTGKRTLICSAETLDIHTHTKDCYDSDGNLICGYADFVLHTHDESCYDEEDNLICTLPEINAATIEEAIEASEPEESEQEDAEQVELDDSDIVVTNVDADEEEDEQDAETPDEDSDSVAQTIEIDVGESEAADEADEADKSETIEPHTHTDACYDEEGSLTCGKLEVKEHVHTEDCFVEETERKLTCGKEEHTHTDECYIDTTADVEEASDWEATLPERSGVWADDLVAVAQSQVGYTESEDNYAIADDDEHKGYTRYGAWYGDAYGDWNTLFAMFCLNYAEIPKEAFPREADLAEWIAVLNDDALYIDAADEENAYEPAAGNLVFLDTNGDGTADRVGIVEKLTESVQSTAMTVHTIEGDVNGAVAEAQYEMGDSSIVGYAAVVNPEDGIMPLAGEEENEAIDYETVETFKLWLQLRDFDGSVVANRVLNNTTEIEDALKYTETKDEEEETYYLVPISNFIDTYKEYGYEFDPTRTEDCPFVYAPNAYNSTENLTPAKYIYVESKAEDDVANSGWYVRVQDTGVGTYPGADPNTPRSNIYYTPAIDTQEVTAFRLWMHVTKKNNVEITQSVANYGQGAEISDVLRVINVSSAETNYYLIPVHYFVEAYGEYGYTFDPDNTDNCPIWYKPNAADGADASNDDHNSNLTTADYVYVEEQASADDKNSGWYVQVQDKGTYGDPPRSNVYFSTPAQTVENTVSPSGTVINLFDYWTTEQIEADVSQNQYNSGINAGHALKFKAGGLQGANTWTESIDPYPGIVANKLTGGYPTLEGKEDDFVVDNNNGVQQANNESLKYLFDPTYNETYRSTHRNVSGLLQVDEQGYYYYNSQKNYAEYDENSNSFHLYDDWSVWYQSIKTDAIHGQFFPFNKYSTTSKYYNSGSDDMNHFFGMTLTARFIQQYEGHTDASKNTKMVFDFSGDDDVWIFIDNVLVADLGGIHDPASVNIDFSTGNVSINGSISHTIKDAFVAAGEYESNASAFRDETFADETYHTLKFFYLERGSYASNLSLKYNLNEYPPTSIYKVNQYGDVVPGATFAVYAADENYHILSDLGRATASLPSNYKYNDDGDIVDGNGNVQANALYVGTTDQKGEMVFVDDDGMPYTLKELQEKFGEYFVLKEIGVPKGYRLVNETTNLYIYENKVLLCANTYESGVWAAPTLQVSAPSSLQPVDNSPPITLEKATGTLFAVVLRYKGDGTSEEELKKQQNWEPLYYNSETKGYENVPVDTPVEGNFIPAVISAAKSSSDNVVFGTSANTGVTGLTLEHLPGDIREYYYMQGNNKSNTRYTVAYYYTTATSLAGATAQNTKRIDADAGGYLFTRAFGATIEVPNLLNRLFVQKKIEENGTTKLVNGASFAMYKVEEDEDEDSNTIYYVADDGTLIDLEKDTDGDNTGGAKLESGDDYEDGTYTVNSDGVIAVKIGNTEYTIRPQNYASGGAVAITQVSTKNTGENGTDYFSNMLDGTYYVREIAAPAGYALNPTEVMVLVDDEGVYANAGTDNDGVTVARGPGYVVSSLYKSASEGVVDNTLTWVYEKLRASGDNLTFSDFTDALEADANEEKSYENWAYVKNAIGAENTYLKFDTSDDANTLFNYTVNEDRYEEGVDTSDITRRLYTDVGWSYYEIYQDYEYGSNHTEANYTDLSGQEIANLFSRSTYIQVTDEKYSNLEISKKVVDSRTDSGTNTDAFTFKVSLYTTETVTDANGEEKTVKTPLSDPYDYTIYNVTTDGNEFVSTEKIEKGSGEITLTNNQLVRIEKLPVGAKYTVTEVRGTLGDPDSKRYLYSTTSLKDKDTDEDAETVSYLYNEEATVNGTLFWKENEDGTLENNTSTVDYTNTALYEKLKLAKVDSDGNPLANAKFVLYYTDKSGTEYYYNNNKTDDRTEDDTWVALGTDEDETKYEMTSDGEGCIIVLTRPLAEGITYYLKELEAPDGYNLLTEPITLKIVADGDDSKVQIVGGAALADGDNPTTDTDGIKTYTVEVANTTGYELPHTGGSGTTMFTLSGLAILAGGLLYGYSMRRKRKGGSD